ncbi:MAG: phage head morphogenesis protein [Chloroflexi bacterium]|nr:phage head morphogenesis protein [Chloroflexota bacterium]
MVRAYAEAWKRINTQTDGLLHKITEARAAGQDVRKALLAGLATGQPQTVIARAVRQALGGNLVRALTIARTEMLRSYREASRQTYLANSDVVNGWIWHAVLSTRTCAACWAMNGTLHKLNERLDDHVRGRCAMMPVTRTWQELGFENVPETRMPIQRGAICFLRSCLMPKRRRFRARLLSRLTRRVGLDWKTLLGEAETSDGERCAMPGAFVIYWGRRKPRSGWRKW